MSASVRPRFGLRVCDCPWVESLVGKLGLKLGLKLQLLGNSQLDTGTYIHDAGRAENGTSLATEAAPAVSAGSMFWGLSFVILDQLGYNGSFVRGKEVLRMKDETFGTSKPCPLQVSFQKGEEFPSCGMLDVWLAHGHRPDIQRLFVREPDWFERGRG